MSSNEKSSTDVVFTSKSADGVDQNISDSTHTSTNRTKKCKINVTVFNGSMSLGRVCSIVWSFKSWQKSVEGGKNISM